MTCSTRMTFSPVVSDPSRMALYPLSVLLTGQVFAEYYLDRKLFDHAVFSTSDFLTLGMYTVFKKRGVLPGRDLQLISYDNFEGRLNRPDFQFGITGITHPQDEMARALCEYCRKMGIL